MGIVGVTSCGRPEDGQVLESAPTQCIDEGKLHLAQYRTALQRYALSTPMQALYRHGYLDVSKTIFDYGCSICMAIAPLLTCSRFISIRPS
jgi:hypothetical protein